MDHYDVVIAGAGPAGLAAAIELGRRQVRCLVVDALEPDAYKLPRTMLANNRTMEHFRRWGIADTLRARNPFAARSDYAADFVFVTSVTGHEIHRFEKCYVRPEREELASERAEWIPQHAIEATMREYAASLPSVEFRWGTEVVGFEQDEQRVRVQVTNGGAAETIEAGYLIGCDGSRSAVRKAMGLRLEGRGDIAKALVYHLRVPSLAQLSTSGFPSCLWVINGEFGGAYNATLNPQDDVGGMQFMVAPIPDGCDPDDTDSVQRLFDAAMGRRVPVDFVGGIGWRLHSIVAPTYDQGRVFIAGDAAHLIPNFGGFGMNISVLDAIDVGWKLAATINGWGGPGLAGSYTAERRAADLWVKKIQDENIEVLSPEMYRAGMEEATPEGQALRDEVKEIIIREKTQEFSSLGCQLGYRYDESPIVVNDGTPAPPLDPIVYHQTARPGALAPHVWLSETESLYDRFGPEFTLLRVNPAADTTALEKAAADCGMPLTTITIPEVDLHQLFEADLILIRPDQHVAWRGTDTADATAVINHIRGA